MLSAVAAGLLVAALVFVGLMIIEKLIHKLTKNPDRSYRFGVWLFAVLAGLYAFATSLGR